MKSYTNKKAIVWDWNGTLLNDLHICVECMNVLLGERGLEPLTDKRYQDIFSFPVKDYYEVAGFDFSREDFEVPAHQFIELYRVGIKSAALQPGVKALLEHYSQRGKVQLILSAMQHDFLLGSVTESGIRDYFLHIFGINNHLAHSKSEVAFELIRKLGMPVSELVLVGDTLHDYEVALETGMDCILISHGHQSAERLKKADCPVVENFNGLMEIL